MPEFIPEIPQNLADAKELVRLIVYYGYQSSQDPPVYRPPLENAQQAGRTLINIRDVLYDYIDALVISSSSSLFGKNDTKIWCDIQSQQLLTLKDSRKLDYVLRAKYIEADKFLAVSITPINAPYDKTFKDIINTVDANPSNFPTAILNALNASGVLPYE